MSVSLAKKPSFSRVYNSFTTCCETPEIAYKIGDMLSLSDLFSLERTSYRSRVGFVSLIHPHDTNRHKTLIAHEKPSIIFYNLFSPDAVFVNTVMTLISLFEKGKQINEEQIVHQKALALVKKVFVIADSINWDLSSCPDIVASPEALEVLAKKNFRKLMRANPNSKEVYFAILPHYIYSWNHGEDNNITSFFGPRLRADEDVAFSVVSLECHFLFDFSPLLQARKELVLRACRTGVQAGIEELLFDEGRFFSLLNPKWRSDVDVMQTVCSVYPQALSLASRALQENVEFLAAIGEPGGL